MALISRVLGLGISRTSFTHLSNRNLSNANCLINLYLDGASSSHCQGEITLILSKWGNKHDIQS